MTGLSGGGKSSALNALEDLSFFCVDNLPAGMLKSMVKQILEHPGRYQNTAIGMDIRMGGEELQALAHTIDEISAQLNLQLIFIEADQDALMRRFSETRRRHPLIRESGLVQAIEEERRLLDPIRQRANEIIDTSNLNIHQLRHRIWRLTGTLDDNRIPLIVIESFAFKQGVPRDVDFLFDARALPNPYWETALRPLDGRDQAVIEWLQSHEEVKEFCEDIAALMSKWLPDIAKGQRSLLTIAIGCTGGQHRSVYITEALAKILSKPDQVVKTYHRELS